MGEKIDKGKTKVYYNIPILRARTFISNKYFRLVIFEVVGMLYSELPDYFIGCFNIVNGAERQ